MFGHSAKVILGLVFVAVLCQEVVEAKKKSVENNAMRIRHLFNTELQIRDVMEQLKGDVENKDDILNRDIQKYLTMHDSVWRSLETVGITELDQLLYMGNQGDALLDDVLVSNAIHVFALMRRCVHLVDKILKRVNETLTDDGAAMGRHRWIAGLRDSTYWPSLDEVKSTAVSVVRVQYTYQLPITDILNGTLGHIKTEAKIQPEDCLFIVKCRLRQQPPLDFDGGPEYALAIEWLEACIEFFGKDETHGTTKTMTDMLIKSRKQHDANFTAAEEGDGPTLYPNEWYFVRPIGEDLALTGKMLRLEEREMLKKRRPGIPNHESFKGRYSPRDHYALCRGEELDLPDVVDVTKRKCYFENKKDNFFRLGPIKSEFIGGVEPQVLIIYHELLSDREVETFKSIGIAEQMNPSRVTGYKLSTMRLQSNVWVSETEHPQLMRFARRLEWLTGMHIAWVKGDRHVSEGRSEPFQMGVYPPGGIHAGHLDKVDHGAWEWMRSVGDRPSWACDRIATVMFYLSTVEGGRTAFPNAGVSSPAEKGSAVFWYDLYDDNSFDDFLGWHGGCPVLYGIKWVVNKWIREREQVFTRPCSLNYTTHEDDREKLKFSISSD